uniref:Sas10 C-terminal domain-containing protein n=1 Tax=Pseudo-nitzschia australis TaxID=44445 RepID=A0A7S4AET8_9STRA
MHRNCPKKESRKLLEKQYPELLPMVSYFSDVVKDLKDRTEIGTKVLMEGEGTAESVGATIKGQQYLLTKSMVQKSIALNSVMYILLRCASVGDEDATSNIQAHPVMDQLKKFTNLLEKLDEGVQKKAKDIDLQLDNLVKAAALMTDTGEGDDTSSGGDDESESAIEMNDELAEREIGEEEDYDEASEDSDEEREAIAQKKQKDYERTLNEARFGLRANEAKKSSKSSRKRRTHQMDDFGDLEESTNIANNLASTMNTIEQRSETASRKRRPAPMAEDLDDLDDHDDRVMQGIKMMEEEMGKLDGGDDDDNGMDMGMDMDDGNITDPDAGDNELYDKIAAKSKEKKSFKKSLYKVAPKFPRVDGEVAGERSLSRVILKNRGLVAHKAKINRNPRVKKREQYRKALIRRKGAVREVRDAQEGNQYGGEQTGIKSRISRSRKL